MLVATISGPNFINEIKKASKYADILEFRLDLYLDLDLKILETVNLPVIFTCRKTETISDEIRIKKLRELLDFHPDYVDLEEDLPNELFEEFGEKTKVICSYHNFEKTPQNLEEILERMGKKKAFIYKIATFARSSLDSISMLEFVKNQEKNVSGMCMGPLGQITRILGPIFESYLDYGCVDHPVVSGQISVQELCETYRYHSINPQTKIYALLGDPVDKSVGHLFHNTIFSLKEKNSVYVKILLKDFELENFFKRIFSLNFFGFSITMPLKEKILDFIDLFSKEDQEIGSINTLVKQEEKWIGSNTDGIGALKALEKHFYLENKNVLILGAGGASKALIRSFLKSKALVTIVNRSEEKAKDLAEKWGCDSASVEILKTLIPHAHLIVNTTPDPTIFLSSLALASSAIVMDIVSFPIETSFIQEARKQGLFCIFGYEMFIHQALYQQKVFF